MKDLLCLKVIRYDVYAFMPRARSALLMRFLKTETGHR